MDSETYVRVRNQDGTDLIVHRYLASKSAQTRWVREFEKALAKIGAVIADYWTLTDGRRLNAEGVRVCYPDANS